MTVVKSSLVAFRTTTPIANAQPISLLVPQANEFLRLSLLVPRASEFLRRQGASEGEGILPGGEEGLGSVGGGEEEAVGVIGDFF